MAGGDHHLSEAVDCFESRAVDLEEAIAGSGDLDLALLRPGTFHVFHGSFRGRFFVECIFLRARADAQTAQNLRCFVFVQYAFLFLPYIKLVFPD